MNNFIYENKTKVYFGKGGVEEHLGTLLKKYGNSLCPDCFRQWQGKTDMPYPHKASPP